MAIVEDPLHSSKASGNLGALCYVNNCSSTIVRGAWSGTQTNTSDQQTCKLNFATAVGDWSVILTQTQRESWENAARNVTLINRLGHKFTPSGRQYYLRIAMRLYYLGKANDYLPPTALSSALVTAFRDISRPTGRRLIFECGYQTRTAADGWIVFRAGPYDSQARKATEPEFKKFTQKGLTWYTDDLTMIDTKWYWYRARWFFNDGNVGNWWYLQTRWVSI